MYTGKTPKYIKFKKILKKINIHLLWKRKLKKVKNVKSKEKWKKKKQLYTLYCFALAQNPLRDYGFYLKK